MLLTVESAAVQGSPCQKGLQRKAAAGQVRLFFWPRKKTIIDKLAGERQMEKTSGNRGVQDNVITVKSLVTRRNGT